MSKQTIGIGSAANDGTGDTLRDAMDKVNDNFTENYNSIAALETITATPCQGTKYTEFRAAIKYFITKAQFMNDLFYVSKIENGVAGHVIVEVKKTSSLSTAGTLVMKSDRTTSARTGVEIVALTEYGSSGLYGIIIIDWDQLTAATSYTCATWVEGGLFAVNIYQSTGGGYPTENLKVMTDDLTAVAGEYDQYINGASKNIDMTMNAFADLKGTVKVNNISDTYTVTLYAAVAEQGSSTFNGTAIEGIVIEPETYVEVACQSAGVFYVKGTYTLPV